MTETKEQKETQEKRQPKKWKGKDWFVILAPKAFGENRLAETPTTDPKTIVGRNIQIGFDELTGNPSKYYMKLQFVIERVDGTKALTRFNGYSTSREYLFRVIRKRTQKIRIINNLETKDGWKLQITTVVVLNRNADVGIQRKIRLKLDASLKETAKKQKIDELVKMITSSVLQQNLKKTGTKIYPVRFTEIEKVEVLSPGSQE